MEPFTLQQFNGLEPTAAVSGREHHCQPQLRQPLNKGVADALVSSGHYGHRLLRPPSAYAYVRIYRYSILQCWIVVLFIQSRLWIVLKKIQFTFSREIVEVIKYFDHENKMIGILKCDVVLLLASLECLFLNKKEKNEYEQGV